MIRVLFNSQELNNPISTLDDLPQLLATVEDKHLPKNFFIRDVLLDGESLVSKGVLDLQGVSPDRREHASQINVLSSSLHEVSREAVAGAQVYLSELEKPVSIVALQFNAGQFDKAFHNLIILLQGISSLISLVSGLESNFALDYSEITAHGATVRTHLVDLREQLLQFVRAQEQQDTVTIADLLDYELKPRLLVWKDILAAVLAEVEKQPISAQSA